MRSSFAFSLSLLFSINLLISNSPLSEAALPSIGNYCPDTQPILPYSTYQKNLNKLLSLLSSAANFTGNNSSSTDGHGGFAIATAGQYPPDQTYGIFLCRGDIDAATCSDCVATAARDIGSQCPYQKTSIIWYDMCMLRYSNQPIYSVMQQVPVLVKTNGLNRTDQWSRFMQIRGQTMDDVVKRAASSGSGKKVAAEGNHTGSPRLYALAECTPDLTASGYQKSASGDRRKGVDSELQREV